jgi:hypothetical protein
MAVVELQFRERCFLDLVGAEALRPPLAPRVLDEIRRRRGGEEEVLLRLTGAEWGGQGNGSRPVNPGVALVRVMLAIDVVDPSPILADAGGGPGEPVIVNTEMEAALWIEVSVNADGVCYELVDLHVGGPVPVAPGSPVPLLIDPDRTSIEHGAVLLERGTVIVRLATEPDDDVHGPFVAQLDDEDWALTVPGGLIAEAVAEAIDEALDTATAWPDAAVRVEGRSSSWWRFRAAVGSPQDTPARPSRMVRLARSGGFSEASAAEAVAYASTRLAATEGLAVGVDLPFTLSAEARLAIDWEGTGGRPVLETMTLVRVEPAAGEIDEHGAVLEDFGPLDLLRDELRAGFDLRLDNRPAGALAVDQGSGALRIDTRRVLTVPTTRAWTGVASTAELHADGMTVTGVFAVRQPGEPNVRRRRGHRWASIRGGRQRPDPLEPESDILG